MQKKDSVKGADLTVKSDIMKNGIEDAIKQLLNNINGEDPSRDGLKGTPDRVARMYQELCSGYFEDEKHLFNAVFESKNDQMIIIKDIQYWSLCEHHMVPFFGKVHIGYIPKGKVLGLSKFARIVEAYARRLQIQEQLTDQIATSIQKYLKPEGVMVVVEGTHLCMAMRGVKKENSTTITSAVRGNFNKNSKTRSEFLSLIK